MTDLDWPSSILLAHAEIDAQHKRMLLLAEAAVESLANSAGHEPGAAQLQALIAFAEEHFAIEESVMRSTGYPEAERHAKSHASLLNELRAYCGRLQQGRNTVPVGLSDFLWFTQHIEEADRELVAWLKSRESDHRDP